VLREIFHAGIYRDQQTTEEGGMADVTVRRIDEMDSLGEGMFVRARADLGVTSFGMGVHNLPPHATHHPKHNHSSMPAEMAHANDGQEEVYIPLSGSATLVVEGEEIPLEPGMMARVGPAATRQLLTGHAPAQILCIGAIPGRPYAAPAWTERGAAYA
jgi:mannose-6-phosphate isomerase-like protein (cupin superfamily)